MAWLEFDFEILLIVGSDPKEFQNFERSGLVHKAKCDRAIFVT